MAAKAQQFVGKVVDAETGVPMECVTVFLTPERGTITNSAGEFSVSAKADETLRFTFVGYKTLFIKAAELPKKAIKLHPLSAALNEVTVLSDDAILEAIAEKLSKDYSKNISKTRKYFNRLTYNNGPITEMIESFIEAQSAVHLHNLKLSSGNHWAHNKMGDAAASYFRDTNIHTLLSIGPMVRNVDGWMSNLKMIFPQNFSIKKLKSLYNITREELEGDSLGNAIIFRFRCQKDNEANVMEGDLYVEPQTFKLLRFIGNLKNIAFERGFSEDSKVSKIVNKIDIDCNITFQHNKGFTEVKDMAFNVYGNDVSFKSSLTDVSGLDLPEIYPIRIESNLLKTIEEAGYCPEMFETYTIIERTEAEKELVNATSGNMKAADSDEHPIRLAYQLAEEKSRPTLPTLSYIKHAMNFNKLMPQEKVYLHLDNTAYFKGETIWFKAYVKRTDLDAATDLSKVLYVELLNPQGDVVETRKLPIVHGVSKGEISVDSIMVTGFYEIRAYTRHMTNWGADACFSRVIPIFKKPAKDGDWSNPKIDIFSYRKRLNNEREKSEKAENANVFSLTEQNNQESATLSSKGVKVSIYPEGGNVIRNLQNRVALYVTDENATPLAEAEVRLMRDEEVLEKTKTDRFGRAVVPVAPGMEDTQIVVGNGTFKMPKALDSGCSMIVSAVGEDNVTIDIHTSADLLGAQMAYVILNGGNVTHCDTLSAKEHTHIAFARSNFKEGVNQITLFGGDGRIYAERLFFVHPKEGTYGKIQIDVRNKEIKPCGKVSIDIVSAPYTNISFTAVDASGLVNGPSGNLNSYMLLSSDIKGFIHNPDYFVEKDDEAHRIATDLLMMVQGWRRYDWKLLSGQSQFNKVQPVEDRLYLLGKVIPKKKDLLNKPLEIGALFERPGIEPFGGALETDSTGQFAFALPDIPESYDLRLVARDNDKSIKSMITLDRNFGPKPRFINDAETQFLPVDTTRIFSWTDYEEDDYILLQNSTKNDILLKDVTVKAKKRVWDRVGWSDEKYARSSSNIMYDVDKEADKLADQGIDLPHFCQWLTSKNSLFAGNAEPTVTLMALPIDPGDGNSYELNTKEHSATGIKGVVEYASYDPEYKESYDVKLPGGFLRFYNDGLLYKNRPVVWIIDNQFATITGFPIRGGGKILNLASPPSKIPLYRMNILSNDGGSTAVDVPDEMNMVKKIYISEDIERLHRHIMSSDLDAIQPIVLYIFTHRGFDPTQKNVRYTTFQGFNIPSTFKTEDYSVLPSAADFRRTIFWNPNVITDASGHAHIEFWNNSISSSMYFDANGMSREGKTVSIAPRP